MHCMTGLRVDIGWVQTVAQYVAVSGPNFTKLCRHTRERFQFATPFSDSRYLVPFRRYSRSKSEVGSLTRLQPPANVQRRLTLDFRELLY